MSEQKKLGISFSGGVARGIGHIGVIKAFEDLNIEFDVISGTSAGAIIAVFYASGFSSEQMIDVLKGNSIFNMLRPSLNLSGLASLTFLKNMLRKHLPTNLIQDLPKPVYLAVTNLSDGICEYKNNGEIDLTVMASCSIPLLLKPTKIENKIYVDGGLMDNLPVKPLETKCDKIIGVNVNPHQFNSNPKNVLSVSQRIFDLMVWRNVISYTENCDYLLDLTEVSKNFNIYDYRKADKIIDAAYHQTMERKEKLLEILS